MPIILATINARFSHASLGLRYLHANMKELAEKTEIMEFTNQQKNEEILEEIISRNPKIIGFGVYIWNIESLTCLVQDLKALKPEILIVLGGPEISYEYEEEPIFKACDHIITGWGDISFHALCQNYLDQKNISLPKVIHGIQPPLSDIKFPYHLYTDEDLKHRVIYIEASRGCPFKCAFCLSSLDQTSWYFPQEPFFEQVRILYQRGLRRFKFVDRTFNLKKEYTNRLLDFFLKMNDLNPEDPVFLHFELVPDFLSEDFKERILRFPPGSLQFEIGIQSLNPVTQDIITRKTNLEKAEKNIRWLSQHTKTHLHVDLIAGLPEEDLESFAKGFNTLWSWKPQEIQLGILKRLKGIPLNSITVDKGFVFSREPPYTVLTSDQMNFQTLCRIKRMAKYWDLIVNSGRFHETVPALLGQDAFAAMLALSDWLFQQIGRSHSIALERLFFYIFRYLSEEKEFSIAYAQALLVQDYIKTENKSWPEFLGPKPKEHIKQIIVSSKKDNILKRQRIHSRNN